MAGRCHQLLLPLTSIAWEDFVPNGHPSKAASPPAEAEAARSNRAGRMA
jgi:hypothetical protein